MAILFLLFIKFYLVLLSLAHRPQVTYIACYH